MSRFLQAIQQGPLPQSFPAETPGVQAGMFVPRPLLGFPITVSSPAEGVWTQHPPRQQEEVRAGGGAEEGSSASSGAARAGGGGGD